MSSTRAIALTLLLSCLAPCAAVAQVPSDVTEAEHRDASVRPGLRDRLRAAGEEIRERASDEVRATEGRLRDGLRGKASALEARVEAKVVDHATGTLRGVIAVMVACVAFVTLALGLAMLLMNRRPVRA